LHDPIVGGANACDLIEAANEQEALTVTVGP
jgi:hypothetical protein